MAVRCGVSGPLISMFLRLTLLCFVAGKASNYNDDFVTVWGDGRAKAEENGRLLTLSLDKTSGSGVEYKKELLFAKVDMQIKLVPGNSAGTIATLYMSSAGSHHDEIDFEFLGNETGQPYTLHTNVFSQGQGIREQQFRLWFNPTEEFHTYSILWNPNLIMLYVDWLPIRAFKNLENIGVSYPRSQAMKLVATLWDGDDWATQGGRVKTDWSKAPFVASYGTYEVQGSDDDGAKDWMDRVLDSKSKEEIELIKAKYMIYDYCSDKKRFPTGEPAECNASWT